MRKIWGRAFPFVCISAIPRGRIVESDPCKLVFVRRRTADERASVATWMLRVLRTLPRRTPSLSLVAGTRDSLRGLVRVRRINSDFASLLPYPSAVFSSSPPRDVFSPCRLSPRGPAPLAEAPCIRDFAPRTYHSCLAATLLPQPFLVVAIIVDIRARCKPLPRRRAR